MVRRDPVWLTPSQLLVLHGDSLRMFGGLQGVRDSGLLDSALARPKHLWGFNSGSSLSQLAASLAFGIARNHPFVDGNKRAALLSIRVFLYLNNVRFEPDETETVVMVEALASGETDEGELAGWIERNSSAIG